MLAAQFNWNQFIDFYYFQPSAGRENIRKLSEKEQTI